MALSILDGNQSATTLSTIVTSGQHIPAHTIVSLGAQAVTDISTAVGLLQSAVATQGSVANTAFVKIGGHTGTATTGNIVHVSSVGAMKVDASASTQPISGTVTVGSLQTIVEDAINNVPDFPNSRLATAIYEGNGETSPARFIGVGYTDSNGDGKIVSDSTPFPVRLLSTINVQAMAGTARIGVVTIGGGTVTIGAGTAQIGSVTASISNFPATQAVSLTTLPALVAGTAQIGSVTASISGTVPISISSVTVGNSVTIGSLPALAAGTAQIGSVTASISANPSGALTTRFGSVTTANTAQITTAVTNTSRKYLFAQNISIGSVTIGIGFSPTTTQGIQLSAGSGIIFDSFCPTGAVYWLGATTGAAWSILEG